VAAVALALVHPWGRRIPTALLAAGAVAALAGELLMRESPLGDGAMRDMLAREPYTVAGHWISVALAAVGVAVASDLAVLTGAVDGGRRTATWDLLLWSPFFGAWGAMWLVAAGAPQPRSRPRSPSALRGANASQSLLK
jgi:hypothetical protein